MTNSNFWLWLIQIATQKTSHFKQFFRNKSSDLNFWGRLSLKLVNLYTKTNHSSQDDTMHFNVMLGNLPNEYTKEKLKEVFLESWYKKFKQSKNVWVYSVDDLVKMNEGTNSPISAFSRYSLKDAYADKSKAHKVEGTWDVLNTWLPSSKLLAQK